MTNFLLNPIISGVIIFVIGQIIQNFILKPLQEYRKVVGQIDNELKFSANIITDELSHTGEDNRIKCSKRLRELSCNLESNYKQLFFRFKNKKVSEASGLLLGISNSLIMNKNGENGNNIKEIRRLLNINYL